MDPIRDGACGYNCLQPDSSSVKFNLYQPLICISTRNPAKSTNIPIGALYMAGYYRVKLVNT